MDSIAAQARTTVSPSTASSAIESLRKTAYELRFRPLNVTEKSTPMFSFPCDERGRVSLDALNEQTRRNYLFARTLIGRHYAAPTVYQASVH